MRTRMCWISATVLTCFALVMFAHLSANASDEPDGVSVELAILTGKGALPAELNARDSLSLGGSTEALQNAFALRKAHPDRDIKVECLRLRGPLGSRLFAQTSQPFVVPAAQGETRENLVEVGHILEIQAEPGEGQLKIHLRFSKSERDESVRVKVNGVEIPGLTSRAMGTYLLVKEGEVRVIEGLYDTRKSSSGTEERVWRAMLLSAKQIKIEPFRNQRG